MDFGKFIEAEMTGKNGNESILTGALPFDQLSVPRHIDLVGNNLYWHDDPQDNYKRDSANATGALNAFVRIKTPDDILQFSRRYGPLGLCKHGLPPMHRGSWYRDVITDGELSGVIYTGEWHPASGASERGWCTPCASESVERWFNYVYRASSCLDFAAQMKVDPQKITVPAKYLKRIASNPPRHIADDKEVPVRGLGKLIVTDMINEWLGDAGIRLELNWSDNEPRLTLTGGGIFGALGVKLLLAITANNLAVCSGCGIPYLRKGRKPQAGRRNFCSDCGDKVANKLRMRNSRTQNKKEVNHNER